MLFETTEVPEARVAKSSALYMLYRYKKLNLLYVIQKNILQFCRMYDNYSWKY